MPAGPARAQPWLVEGARLLLFDRCCCKQNLSMRIFLLKSQYEQVQTAQWSDVKAE
jgi:hypothetical protein